MRKIYKYTSKYRNVCFQFFEVPIFPLFRHRYVRLFTGEKKIPVIYLNDSTFLSDRDHDMPDYSFNKTKAVENEIYIFKKTMLANKIIKHC